MNWKKYKKLIAAVVGVSALVLMQNYGVSVPGISDLVIELIVSALTAFGVYQVENEV